VPQQRLIDVPIESLPFVDEHSISIDATPERAWDALVSVLATGFSNSVFGRTAAHRLECRPGERKGELPTIGSTIPGFIVCRSIPPAVLALMGEHRFSRYALIFRITEREGAPLLVSAETRAEFPGRSGSAYRMLVVGSHGHVFATRSILRGIRKRAQHPGVGP
jgi:hypothetical protein